VIKNRKILVIYILLLVSILMPSMSIAAGSTMSFSPSAGSYEVGSIFSVGIFLSSVDQATNAVSGTVTFPEDKLEVVSLSKSGSIISLWVLEPSFSNNAGTVDFEAIVLNPGFTGSAGRIITINFRVRSSGDANVGFSAGVALANDGVGTSILESLGNANFSLAEAVEPGAITPEPAEGIPLTLDPPTITKYSEKIHVGEIFAAKGETYPNANVVIWLQQEGEDPKNYIVESNNNGDFVFVADDMLGVGTYGLWAEVFDEFGARSGPSEKLTVTVEQLTIPKIAFGVVNFFIILILPVALIILLLILIWYALHKRAVLREKIEEGAHEAEHTLHEAFDLLREDVNKQIRVLEKAKTKRGLTKEEERVARRLKKSLRDAEKLVRDKIKDIEKEVK